MHELGVLDAQDLLGGAWVVVRAHDLGGVEHQAHGRVADGVGRDADAGRAGLPHPADEVVELDGRDATVVVAAVLVRFEHRGRPGAERAVREQLEQADPEPVAAEAGAQARLRPLASGRLG